LLERIKKMSRLQKSAWINLCVTVGCVLISGLGFAFLTVIGAKGIINLMIFFVTACLVMPASYVFYRRWAVEARFDERERMIYRRAFILAACVAILFQAGVCIVPFFLLGADSVIPIYYLPVIFLSTFFTTQFAHSIAILIQCALEEDNG
jgi:hypothetical protein